MADKSMTYNAGSFALQHQDVDFLNDAVECVLVTPAYVAAADPDDTSSEVASGEIGDLDGYEGGFGGSGRKLLASKTITNDTSNDRTKYDAADPSAWTIATGDEIGGVVIMAKGDSDDTTATPLFLLDLRDHDNSDAGIPTNGAAITIQFASTGIAYTQNGVSA